MTRPTITVTPPVRDGSALYDLRLEVGADPGQDIRNEFVEITGKHSLPPTGGCYAVRANWTT